MRRQARAAMTIDAAATGERRYKAARRGDDNWSALNGDADTITAHNAKLASDPVTGELGELGFGTQILPTSGRDIQDEKILGTIHVATGRSDHLGGSLTPDKFAEHLNATHVDILFAPHKTSEIWVTQARMHRDGQTKVLIENYEPSDYILDLRK
jgi:hypothetical protein